MQVSPATRQLAFRRTSTLRMSDRGSSAIIFNATNHKNGSPTNAYKELQPIPR